MQHPEKGLEIRVLDSLARVDSTVWDGLDHGGNPFLSHAFLAGLERENCLRPHGWQPLHLAAYQEGTLVGAAPLYAKFDSTGEFVFDWNWAEAYERAGGRYYPKLVGAIPYTPVPGARLLSTGPAPQRRVVGVALLRAAIQLARDNHLSSLHWLFVDGKQLEEAGAVVLPEHGLLTRYTIYYRWWNRGYTSFTDFLDSLDSKRRKEIRRERARVAATGLRIEVLRGADIQPRHWEAFYRFYVLTFARKSGLPRFSLEFFQALQEFLPGAPLLILARRAGSYVAGAYALLGANAVYGRHWGCSEFHPCLHFELCYYQLIDYCIHHGLRYADAGVQGPHKLARGFQPECGLSLHWLRDPGFQGVVADYLGRERAMVKQELQRLCKRLPFRAEERA